jgi:hypothetical protein
MTTGFKTPAFWLTMLAVVVALLIELVPSSDKCDGLTWVVRFASMVSAGLAAVGYAYSRGKAKSAALADPKPLFGTTEFWISLLVGFTGAVPIAFMGAECPADATGIKEAGAIAMGLAFLGFGVQRQLGKQP